MSTTNPRLIEYSNQGMVDLDTGLFSSKFFKTIIAKQVQSYERYQAFFSVVLVTIPGKTLKQVGVDLKTIASFLRSNVRVVDEIGASGKGQFCVLLPHTLGPGAAVVADRIRDGLRELMGSEGSSVDVYSVPECMPEIMALAQ
ncbi:MAG: nucleotidyl cyclase domain-containing protein [Candidatus Aquicultorales bacterium]